MSLVVAMLAPSPARALDLPPVGGEKPNVQITETSIVAKRFEARDREDPLNQGYASWLNRLNLQLDYKRITVTTRLDSALYLDRPEDRSYALPNDKRDAIFDGASRYRDSLYPAKLWVTYKGDRVSVTVGDTYVQFGRGLVLSMRRIDELGIDTTIRGGKVVVQEDPFALTLVGGLANPARVDDATGRALFLPKDVPGEPLLRAPLFGSDRIVGAALQSGRGLPITTSTHVMHLSRCAPYRYDAGGRVIDGELDRPVGTCAPGATEQWQATLPLGIARSGEVTNAGQSVEVPSLWGHGSLYLEGAVQKTEPGTVLLDRTEGNALYGSLVTSGGPLTNTFEVKSYRNFYPVQASVNTNKAAAFSNVAYSAPPTAEDITQDSMFGSYNACVDGGRNRLDTNLSSSLLVWGSYGYFVTKSEAPGGICDEKGRSLADDKAGTRHTVTDLTPGLQYRWDKNKSLAVVTFTLRNDVNDRNERYYRERSFTYDINKHLGGAFTLEVQGRHRVRDQLGENILDGDLRGRAWVQGEHQNGIKISPKWVLAQGVEYTSLSGQPFWYFNGNLAYRFTPESNLRIFGGQNRGGLKCVSGVCRFFPPFSGVRAELTLRF